MPVSLEAALINEAPGTHPLDLLEDRSCARMKLEPWMTCSSPAEVFLHDAMHCRSIAVLQLECHGQRDIPPVVQYARVITELHVAGTDGLPLAFFRQQIAGMK